MTTEKELEQFYKSFSGKGALPLDPDDPRYVPMLEEDSKKDPILALRRRTVLAESESVHLLTGFRGNGKTTELKRLKKLLEQSGCLVFLVDMLKYVFMTKPIAISDLTLSLMAALSESAEELGEAKGFKLAPLRQSYWERLSNFLKSKVELKDITLKSSLADLGLALTTDDVFKAKIQKHLEGQLTQLIDDARLFVTQLVNEIRKQSGDPDLKIVLLVDSLEQLRGIGDNAKLVYDSVRETFSGQASKLAYSQLHIVYTVPPYLPVLSPNLTTRTLDGGPLFQWPNIHVRHKNGEPDQAGLVIMKRIVEKRFPGWNEIIPESFIYQFATCSGGDIRDFFRLLRDATIRLLIKHDHDAAAAVLDEEMVKWVIQQLRNDVAPIIAQKDAEWLAEIHQSKEAKLPEIEALPDLVRFFDGNLIMNYLNNEPWYDVHPLLVEKIERMTKTN